MSQTTRPEATGKEPIADLVRRCKRGDRDAQGDLYRRTRDEVARTLYRVLGPDPALEDAVQDVFVEVFRGLPAFRGEARFSTWLYRVTVNVALQRLRRRARRPEGYRSPLEDLPHEETPLRALERKDASRIVHGLLDALSPKKRVVFVLAEIAGLAPREIAAVLGVNPLTARTRLHYARKEFYRLLVAAGGDVHAGQEEG